MGLMTQGREGLFFTLRRRYCNYYLLIQIHERYSIPAHSQRFIVGRVWPKDSDVLSRCGLLMDNAELFVYVMSNTAVITPSVSTTHTVSASSSTASASNGQCLADHAYRPATVLVGYPGYLLLLDSYRDNRMFNLI